MMHYDKTKRDKIDICNICLESKHLTWDHVPPKCCSNDQNVEIASFFDKMKGNNSTERPKIFQNGMKYRTICGDCNSLLGSKYDDELNKLVKALTRLVNSSLIIPPIIKLKVRPLPIIKSVVGHILAAKSQLDGSKCDSIFREFVLNENAPIPEGLNLYYWIYPFENTIVVRDFAMMNVSGKDDFNKCSILQLLKFFPIAFMLSNVDSCYSLPSLTSCSKNISKETEREIPILFYRSVERFWPERISDGNIMLATSETENAVYVTKRAIVKKK